MGLPDGVDARGFDAGSIACSRIDERKGVDTIFAPGFAAAVFVFEVASCEV